MWHGLCLYGSRLRDRMATRQNIIENETLLEYERNEHYDDGGSCELDLRMQLHAEN